MKKFFKYLLNYDHWIIVAMALVLTLLLFLLMHLLGIRNLLNGETNASLMQTYYNNNDIDTLVRHDNVVIVEHPTIKGIYGVTVHQKWNTARYSDEGYVFMVWDFRNPDAPQIHVRTWQPDYIDKEHGQKLNPNDVFSLGDFDL